MQHLLVMFTCMEYFRIFPSNQASTILANVVWDGLGRSLWSNRRLYHRFGGPTSRASKLVKVLSSMQQVVALATCLQPWAAHYSVPRLGKNQAASLRWERFRRGPKKFNRFFFQATAEEMRTAGLLEPQKGQLLNSF